MQVVKVSSQMLTANIDKGYHLAVTQRLKCSHALRLAEANKNTSEVWSLCDHQDDIQYVPSAAGPWSASKFGLNDWFTFSSDRSVFIPGTLQRTSSRRPPASM